MTALRFAVVVLGLGWAMAGTAAAQNGMCPPPANGVPFDPGPPQWRAWTTGPTGNVRDSFDDPRWRGAAAIAYNSASGSANPPVQFRSIWASEGGRNYLYAQWIVRVGIFGQPTQGLDLFVGFQRPDAGNLPADHQRASLIRFHVAGTPDVTASANPTLCAAGACPDSSDNYRVYDSFQASGPSAPGAGDGSADVGTCSTITGDGLHFRQRAGDVGWINESVRVMRAGCTSTTCDQWVLSLRIPVADRVPGNLSLPPDQDDVIAGGIETGSHLWYQLDLPVGSSAAMIDAWPRYTPPAGPPAGQNPICFVPSALSEEYYQRDLDDLAAWSPLTLWNGDDGSRPDTCFTGIALTPDHVGVIPRAMTAPAPADGSVLTAPLGQEVKAYVPGGGARSTNLVVARPINNGPDLTTKLRARFRLAQWGAQPRASNAVWGDITPGASGVCASGSPSPTCGDVTIPHDRRALLRFDFTIGGPDGSFTLDEAEQYCRYGITPPAGFVCVDDCVLPGSSTCTPSTQVGCGVRTDPSASPGGGVCKPKLWFDQCVLVELGSDSAANFENHSVYRNLLIGAMSETQREAVISTGGLPPIPGKPLEDIYLVVMPRNMPATLPGTNGVAFVQDNSRRLRDRLLAPYVEAAARLSDEERRKLAERVARMPPAVGGVEPEVIALPEDQLPGADLPAGAELMPRDLRNAAEVLDGLSRYDGDREYGGQRYGAAGVTRTVLDVVDDVTATAVVPTLDVYAFRATTPGSLTPMTSFSLVVHHDGPLYGIVWEIDGAERLGPNLFKLTMPSGHKKRIQVRAMAKETPSERQRPGNPRWPCTGGCCGGHAGHCSEPEAVVVLGQTLPFGLAAVFAGARRRRRRRRAGQD